MKKHRLKTWATAFEAIEAGRKTFEVRFNDRFFQAGDLVELVKVSDEAPHYNVNRPGERFSEITLQRRIGWMLHGGQFGIQPGYVVFQLEPVEPTP